MGGGGDFVVMAASDALDGYLARVKKQTRSWGRFWTRWLTS